MTAPHDQGAKGLGQSKAVHAAVAILAMGGWAIFANRHHPWPQPLIAGAVQGAMSGAITLLQKRLIEHVSMRFPNALGMLVAPVAAVLTSLIILGAAHLLAGTPEIFATIAVPLCVTALYALSYSYALWRLRR